MKQLEHTITNDNILLYIILEYIIIRNILVAWSCFISVYVYKWIYMELQEIQSSVVEKLPLIAMRSHTSLYISLFNYTLELIKLSTTPGN